MATLAQAAKTGKSNDGVCKGDYCRVSPESMNHLQDILQSDRTVEFEKGDYQITSSSNGGFIQVQDVVNLTIIGHGVETQILCSPNATFGFYFNNVSNLTISGLSISSCSAPIPSTLLNELPLDFNHEFKCDLFTNSFQNIVASSSVLTIDSESVSFLNVSIKSSPGYALVAMKTFLPELTNFGDDDLYFSRMPTDILVGDSDMSLNKQGSLLFYRTKPLLQTTVFINSTFSVLSLSSKVSLTDMYLFSSPMILIQNKEAVMTGNVEFHQSPTCIIQSGLIIKDSNVTFLNTPRSNLTTMLMVLKSSLSITSNAFIVFKEHVLSHSSLFFIQESNISIQDGANLLFANNTVSDGAHILYTKNSHVTIKENASTIIFEQNTATNYSRIMYGTSGNCNIMNNARIIFQGNTGHNSGNIMKFKSFNVNIAKNASITFNNNKVGRNSFVLHFLKSKLFIEESELLFTSNNCSDNCRIFFLYKTNATIQGTSCNNNISILFQNNKAEVNGKNMVLFESNITIVKNANISFINNKVSNASIVYAIAKSTMLVETSELQFIGNDCYNISFIFYINVSFIEIRSTSYNNASVIFQGNTGQNHGHIMVLYSYVDLKIVENAKFIFSNNEMSRNSTLLSLDLSFVLVEESKLIFASNDCYNNCLLFFGHQNHIEVQDSSHNDAGIVFEDNKARNNAVIMHLFNTTFESLGSAKLTFNFNKVSDGSFASFTFCLIALSGETLIKENTVTEYGVLNFYRTNTFFEGKLECLGNKAKSGAVLAENSDLFFIENVSALFLENTAIIGGAMFLHTSTVLISPYSTVNFTRNHASELGGAVYITKPRYKEITIEYCGMEQLLTAFSCTIQVFFLNLPPENECKYITLFFNQNTAEIAGNAVYGGRTSACMPTNEKNFCNDCHPVDFSLIAEYTDNEGAMNHLSNFTSDPTRVCFCEDGTPQCFFEQKDISVHPGELFTLSLATIGYGFGTVPGSVLARILRHETENISSTSLGSSLQQSQGTGTECTDVYYSIQSEELTEDLVLAVETTSFMNSLKRVKDVVHFKHPYSSSLSSNILTPTSSQYELFFHIPVFVRVSLLPCPIGFQLINGQCTCAQILINNGIDLCTMANGTSHICRTSSYWIGFPADNSSGIMVHSPCPYDYCVPHGLNITPQTPDRQCQFHRSGILCGGCQNGFSTILGSSECKKCSNVYLTLIAAFAVAGLVLVAFLFLLNLTVSVGTINGLIFYANIVQAINTAFLPMSNFRNGTMIPLKVFIAWVNLDLGISTCFYNGMDAYTMTWLQFAFPFYILAIVSAIIIASHYSTRAVKVFGNNAVPILATLFLLSYAKMLRILISAFSFTILNFDNKNTMVVWLLDGNIAYFELKHALLFLVALLVLIAIAIPYTSVLILAPWIQKSKYVWISRMYNKFKPLFDAHTGPYKDKYRYWTGLLLLVRAMLFIMFSSIANTNALESGSINLFIVNLVSCFLLAATTTFKPYKKKMNNVIESCYLLNLVLLSSSSLYISDSSSNQIYAYSILVGVAFLGFLMVIGYHIYLKIPTKKSHTSESPPSSQDDERFELMREEEEEEGEDFNTNSTVFNLSLEPSLK